MAAKAQGIFHVQYKGLAENADDGYGADFNLSLPTNTRRTVTHIIPASSVSRGELTLRILLGLIPQTSGNTFTVSNIKVDEVSIGTVRGSLKEMTSQSTVNWDSQAGYFGKLNRTKDSASLDIQKTPADGAEAWKSKLFIDTGVSLNTGETWRVRMDVLAEQDMNYEVCYNSGGTEKGFDAVYDLHAASGKVQTIERLFTAEARGKLILQLSLGNVPAPNHVTVRNVHVEKVTLSGGGNALPAPLTFRAPSAVSYWAHADYTTALSGSDNAVTMNILKPPSTGAEPWKIKLFLDTAAVLQAGKFYRVSTDLQAQRAQTVEICYNNGGAEMGYDSMGGIQLAAGEKKTVEKIIGVPADKTDTANLMLQINLGKAVSANAVTVSGVTVEEVSIAYVDMLQKGFSYQAGKTVTSWTYSDYSAELVNRADRAGIRITQVPSSGTEVWKVKMFVKTGAVLTPGKSYLVHAELKAAKAQNYEVCYNNEETEKGFDVLYAQSAPAGSPVSVDKKITVPADMTDAGELILQFSLGGPVQNEFEVSGVTVQEMDFGGSGGRQSAPDTVINLPSGTAGTLNVTRRKMICQMPAVSPQPGGNAVELYGASLQSGERYTVEFKASANQAVQGRFLLYKADGVAVREQFALSAAEQTYTFTTAAPLPSGGAWKLAWQFESATDRTQTAVTLSDVKVYAPSETLTVQRSSQNVTVNGIAVKPAVYTINGSDYMKLRDLALLLNGTDAHFVVRYNKANHAVSITTGKEYTPIGGELSAAANRPGTCVRSPHGVAINGKAVHLKAYYIDRNNYYRLGDLCDVLGFAADYDEPGKTTAITSPLTPENQEASHSYKYFFRPEIDGDSQPYVGDPMPYYEDGTYYIYYLKEGGDSYNHSVYLTTTQDFANYTEQETPVLGSSREDRQDSWIGTGSVVKVDGEYYLFYTGHAPSAAYEYGETLMAAKSGSLTSFERVNGWEILPPAELGQKNDFRDPQAYYDPQTQTISLTVTASQGGTARILKFTMDRNLQNVSYDGIIFTDPTGAYWNLECSDTFRIGDKWYLTYSGQEDTLWYAMADSRFGPYSDPVRMEGKIFYAAKHVENGENTYMVGWARRSETASSTQEVSGWGGNLVVQKVNQQADGKLVLVPVDSIVEEFEKNSASAVNAPDTRLQSDTGYSYERVFTCGGSYMLRGQFACSGDGAFGLAFDFNGKEGGYKFISLVPSEQKLRLSFNQDETPIAETQVNLVPNQTYSFTYIQDGSVGIFYLDGQAALVVRLYGVTGKAVSLFAENNSVTFTSLRQYTR